MRSREWNLLPADMQEIIERNMTEAPVPLGAISRELGLVVKTATLPPGISGEIRPSQDAPSGFMIRINRHENRARQRFTLAHEIAHFLLHRDNIGDGVVDDLLFRSSLSNSREAQANRLGADLIMPWSLIDQKLKKHRNINNDEMVESMARDFDVSTTAMKIRLGIDD